MQSTETLKRRGPGVALGLLAGVLCSAVVAGGLMLDQRWEYENLAISRGAAYRDGLNTVCWYQKLSTRELEQRRNGQ